MGHEIQYVRIVLTKKCNMSCVFCHQEGCEFFGDDLSTELLKDTVPKLYQLGFRKIKLMGGEPMLHSNISEIVSEIANMADDIDLSMVSNGTATIDEYMDLFNRGLNRLNISVHGWTEDYFVKNTGSSPCLLGIVKDNIKSLAAEQKLNKLNYVIQKNRNEKDFFEFIDYIKDFNVMVDVLNLLISPSNIQDRKLQYSFPEIIELLDKQWGIVDEKKVVNKYSLPSTRIILKNGCVINLKSTSLNSQRIFKACDTCVVRDYCVEGIKAIRITNNGILQPCLLRQDNILNIIEKPGIEELERYFDGL